MTTRMAPVRLCATVTAETTAGLRAARDAAAGADLVELRLDGVQDLDVAGALAGRTGPVVVTCRPIREGGRFDGAEEERCRVLERAFDLGADWVDLEWGADFERLVADRRGRNVVLSMHDFEGTPADLESRYRAMRATGAEVVKIAAYSRSAADVVRLRRLGRGAGGEPTVLVGMGPIGVPTRLLPAHFGSAWTYAGDGVAPGQVPLADMLGRYRCGRTSASTAVYGVAGVPIAHSLSPVMHNAGFAAAGLDAVYVPFEAAGVGDLMELVQALGVRGLSVTAPFKESILDYAADVDPVARKTGAVNTLRADGGRWRGMNTDVAGFLAPLEALGEIRGLRCCVLGAGGAARAAAVGLAGRGGAVTVCARRPERAAEVAALAGGVAAPFPPPPGSWDLLVNTTPVGTAPLVDETPLPRAALAGGSTVYDLVYNPGRTRLLRDAEAAGCRTVGGLDMLAAQAERQFEWWCGARPAPGLFLNAARAALAASEKDTARGPSA